MHIGQCIVVYCQKKDFATEISINSSVYTFSTAANCIKIFIYSIIPYQSAFSIEFQAIEKTTLIFALNHKLIKKGVNKQIKLFYLLRVKQAIKLWAFPLENKSFILVFIVSVNSCVQTLCINTGMV